LCQRKGRFARGASDSLSDNVVVLEAGLLVFSFAIWDGSRLQMGLACLPLFLLRICTDKMPAEVLRAGGVSVTFFYDLGGKY